METALAVCTRFTKGREMGRWKREARKKASDMVTNNAARKTRRPSLNLLSSLECRDYSPRQGKSGASLLSGTLGPDPILGEGRQHRLQTDQRTVGDRN